MPRAFTDAERERIRERLLAVGRELFARYGLRKTTVEELARASGIAKGTFYLFFPSKEALYAEVLLREAPRMLGELIAG
ncbi:TetR/AcrR family transcriptional regulator, partial [Candidatus Acetothermia bacterium]